MPEIDLRKLREMQLAQTQNHEDSSENTASAWSEITHGIIDLWTNNSSSSVVSENLMPQKPPQKDVWIDTPHERVSEISEDKWIIKAKPIKISLSSLSQHQKQKDPERLYQEKEEALGKIFGESMPQTGADNQDVWSGEMTDVIQTIPQETKIPEEEEKQIASSIQEDPIISISSLPDQTDMVSSSQEDRTAPNETQPVIASQFVEPISTKDESSVVENMTTQESVNTQDLQRDTLENTLESSSQSSKDTISASWIATSPQAGFFPELSFITPISISKPEDLWSDVAPGENDTIISNESVTPLIDATPLQEAVTLGEQEPQEVLSHSEVALTEIASPIEWSQSSSSDEVSVLWEAAVMPQDISISETIEWSSVLAETSPLNETPPQESGAQNLHETNKKSLRWVISGVVVMLLTLGWGGFYLWNNQSQISVPTPNNETDETIINIADLPKNPSSTWTLTGAIMTWSILTGTTIETTGSTILIGTWMMNTSSGVLIGSGLMSSSGGISMSGVTSTWVLVQSGTIKPTPSSGSGTVGNSWSLVSNTSTGKVITSTWSNTSTGKTVTGTGSSTSKPNTSTGSTVITPAVTPPKYIEGRDYRVYGGGYKLIRTVKKK